MISRRGSDIVEDVGLGIIICLKSLLWFSYGGLGRGAGTVAAEGTISRSFDLEFDLNTRSSGIRDSDID
jgi:hypothetical protein